LPGASCNARASPFWKTVWKRREREGAAVTVYRIALLIFGAELGFRSVPFGEPIADPIGVAD
jgi:hypothetical protein